MILKSEFKNHTRDAASTMEVILWSIIGVFMAYFAQAIAVIIEIKVFGIEVGSEKTAMLMEMTRIAPRSEERRVGKECGATRAGEPGKNRRGDEERWAVRTAKG